MSSMEKSAEAFFGSSAYEEMKQWEQSLKVLFDQLEIWLKPLVAGGVAKITRVTKRKTENPSPDVSVSYSTPMLIINFDRKTAVVDTIGLFVLNTDGRVVLIGDDKRFLMTRSLQPTEHWDTVTYLNIGDQTPSVERPLSEDALAEFLSHFM